MKTMITNIIDSTIVTVGAASTSAVVAGKEADNLLVSDILMVYAAVGNFDVSVFGIGGQTVDCVAICNCYFDNTMTLEFYDAGDALVYTHTFTVNDLHGFDFLGCYVLLPVGIDYVHRIRLFSSGGDDYTEKYVGYVYAGTAVDIGCVESCQPQSLSNDDVQISRSNHPDISESYLYRELDFTTKKEIDFKDLRTIIEAILSDGYGKGRPWILEEAPFNGEMIFGNMDSGKVKFNLFKFESKTSGCGYSAQVTLGIREIT